MQSFGTIYLEGGDRMIETRHGVAEMIVITEKDEQMEIVLELIE